MTDTIFVVDLTAADRRPKCKIGCCAFCDFLEPTEQTTILVRCKDAEAILKDYFRRDETLLGRFSNGDGTYDMVAKDVAIYIKKMLAYEWQDYDILRDLTDTIQSASVR